MIKNIYGVFIHTWHGKTAIGLFPKESALGLVRILESRFGTDGDDMTGAFGPLDCTKPYIILEEDLFNIVTSNQWGEEFTQTFATEGFLPEVGKLYDCETKEFREPAEIFNAWYSEDTELAPIEIAWE